MTRDNDYEEVCSELHRVRVALENVRSVAMLLRKTDPNSARALLQYCAVAAVGPPVQDKGNDR